MQKNFLLSLIYVLGKAHVFHVDKAFSKKEVVTLQRAADIWNRYTKQTCHISLHPQQKKLDHSTINPPYDRIWTIRGDLTRKDSSTFTIKRKLWRGGVVTTTDIDININLLYTRTCPSALLVFVLHEFGHVLGLEHNDYTQSLMNVTSAQPACAVYPLYRYLPAVDVYFLYVGRTCRPI